MRIVLALILSALLTYTAAANAYSPPVFLFDVKAGDSIESVIAQQGWYECGQGSFQHLCYDGVVTLGETGRFVVKFINNKAFHAQFLVKDTRALYRMIDRLPDWQGGDHTLVYVETSNTEIDIVKAVHELGGKGALEHFSRYLKGDGQRFLRGITFVPRSPPPERQYMNADEYLSGLPKGGIILELSNFKYSVMENETFFNMSLPLADKKELFPEFCNATCTKWSIPSLNE